MNNLLYDALMLGRNKKIANEEFLVATGRKQAASFKATEDCVDISNVISDGEFFVHLEMESEGYMEIEVICPDNFIIFDKKIITSDEFISGKYDFRFMVISDRLHNGKNYSSITFRTSCQDLEVPVRIDNKIRVRISDINPRLRSISLERLYLDLKTEKIQQWDWSQESLKLLGDFPAGDEEALYLMLYKALICLSRNDNVHARNFIEYVGTQIPKLDRKDYDLYCCFIYLASLYEEVDGTINAVLSDAVGEETEAQAARGSFRQGGYGGDIMEMSSIQKVRWVYSHYPSWMILCILIYMDPQIRGNRKAMLEMMRQIFYSGTCISPVLYLEALKLFRLEPELMDQAGQFELQVVNFAVKNRYLTLRIADTLAQCITDVSGSQYSDSDRRLCIQVLKSAYESYAGGKILKALCSMLTALDVRDGEYHKYFARAVEEGLSDEDICNYFIYTMDLSSMEALPGAVMRHFSENTELLYEYKAYMYANMIIHKYSNPEEYKENLSSILKFAEYQIVMGQNNECLSVIYREILENDLITPNMKDSLFDVVCTREILCDNPRMRSVLVFHKELQVYQESLLRQGRAYIKIYSGDALVLFQDYTGNIYYHVKYTVNTLLKEKEYIDKCIRDARINKYMLIGDTFPLLRAYKPPLEILRFFTDGMSAGELRHDYELNLRNTIVSYYAKNSRDPEVYDELLKFLDFDLQPKTRGILISILIKRGLADRAFEEVREHGLCELDGQDIALLAETYIKQHGDREDELLTSLCEAGFTYSGYEGVVFDYLHKYYNGDLDLLAQLYRSSKAYNKPSREIEERILAKAVETQQHPEIVSTVFRRYYESTGSCELTKRYMEFCSARYLYGIMKGSQEETGDMDLVFFDYMEKEMMHGEVYTDDSVIAYLLRRMSLAVPDERQLRNIEHKLKDLVRRGKMLEEFKYYKKFFELPSTLLNNIIISAFSEEEGQTPEITYEITGSGNTIYNTEPMEEIFRFCYVKYFTLFYGEKVVFSMNGEQSATVRYADMDIKHDGSRYAAIDDLIRYRQEHDRENFERSAAELFLKEKLTERLF